MSPRRRILFFTVFSILGALQVLAVVVHIYSFVPIHWRQPIPPGLQPERESFFYFIFLGAAVLLMVAAWLGLKDRMEQNEKMWAAFLGMEAVWVCLMGLAFFKWVTYAYPFYNILPTENGRWVWPFFYVVVLLSVLSKIFWPEIFRFRWPRWPAWFDLAAVPATIVLLLWPNAEQVVALTYMTDQFRDWQQFWLTRWLLGAGLSHAQIVAALFAVHAMALSLLYVVLRWWWKDVWLAALVLFLVVRVNMFHYGLTPVCWAHPQFSWLFQGYWPQGLGMVPMFEALKVRQFFSFWMGYLIPVFYVMTILCVGRSHKWVVAISVYGLWIYANYIQTPGIFKYGAVAVPAIVLLGFWLNRLLVPRRRLVLQILTAAAVLSLLTSRLYVAYPHVLPVFGQAYSKAIER